MSNTFFTKVVSAITGNVSEAATFIMKFRVVFVFSKHKYTVRLHVDSNGFVAVLWQAHFKCRYSRSYSTAAVISLHFCSFCMTM